MMQKEQWQGFEGRLWKEEINVRDFIQNNYTPYEGDSSFLADPTEATNQLWGKLQELQKEERAVSSAFQNRHLRSALFVGRQVRYFYRKGIWN